MNAAQIILLSGLLLSLTICIICTLIHFQQHFRFQCCHKYCAKPDLIKRISSKMHTGDTLPPPLEFPKTQRRSSMFSREIWDHPEVTNLTQILCHAYCPKYVPVHFQTVSLLYMKYTYVHLQDVVQWCLRSRDDEEFNFFPYAFMWYQLLMIFLCVLILAQFIATEIKQPMLSITAELHSAAHRSSFNALDKNEAFLAIDWIIVYGICFLNNWELLFVFYRYYSMKQSLRTLCVDSTMIFKLYARFAVFYLVLFALTMHVYYWLFPVLIAFVSTFALFCTYRASAELLDRFKTMDAMMEVTGSYQQQAIEEEMMKSVYFMRNASMISVICSIIYVSLFLIIYAKSIFFYLPLIWCIICVSFTFTFVRNRAYITTNLHRLCYRRPKLQAFGIQSGSAHNADPTANYDYGHSDMNTKETPKQHAVPQPVMVTSTSSARSTLFRFTNKTTVTVTPIGTPGATPAASPSPGGMEQSDDREDEEEAANSTKYQITVDGDITPASPYESNQNGSPQPVQPAQSVGKHALYNSHTLTVDYLNQREQPETSTQYKAKKVNVSRSATRTFVIHGNGETPPAAATGDVYFDMDGQEIPLEDSDGDDEEQAGFEFVVDDEDDYAMNTVRFHPGGMQNAQNALDAIVMTLPALAAERENSRSIPTVTPNQSVSPRDRTRLSPRDIVVAVDTSRAMQKSRSANSAIPSNITLSPPQKQSSPRNHTAEIKRAESTPRTAQWKGGQSELKNKWLSKWRAFTSKTPTEEQQQDVDHGVSGQTAGKKQNERNDKTAAFGKSQSVNPTRKQVHFAQKNNHLHPRHRANTDNIVAKLQQSRSNPVDPPTRNYDTDGNESDHDLPQMAVHNSDPVANHRFHQKPVLAKKESMHVPSKSAQTGQEVERARLSEAKRRHFGHQRSVTIRKLVFDKLPLEMQELPEPQKKTVEEFANLNMMLSLHGFAPKNKFFQFQLCETPVDTLYP